jgi:hypothetical protein
LTPTCAASSTAPRSRTSLPSSRTARPTPLLVYVGAHGDYIVFFTGPGMRKARNLRRDPRVALSIAPVDDTFTPVVVRGRVVEWIEGDAAWEIVDQLAAKYTGAPYPRGQERVVAVIEPERQAVGIG